MENPARWTQVEFALGSKICDWGANYALFKWPSVGTLLQHVLLNSCGRGKFEFQHCTRSRNCQI